MRKTHVNISLSNDALEFISTVQERYQLSRSEAIEVNTFFNQCSFTEEDMDYMFTKLYKRQDGRKNNGKKDKTIG